MDSDCRYVKSSNLVSRKIQDEVILVPIRNNVGDLQHIFTLNEVGAFIWGLLDEGCTAGALKKAILAEFTDADPVQVESDLADFLSQLEGVSAIVLQPSEASVLAKDS